MNAMKVEIGKIIQEVFETRNMRLTEFADALGTVRQNVYRIFKKRNLDTGLLLKISQVLDHNFFKYYVEPLNVSGHIQNLVQAKLENQETKLQLEVAKKEIEYLKKIIRLMGEKSVLTEKLENDAMGY